MHKPFDGISGKEKHRLKTPERIKSQSSKIHDY